MELLASTPLTMNRYVAAKIISAVAVGFMSGGSSAIGMAVYILVVVRAVGGTVGMEGSLLGLARQALAAALTPSVIAAVVVAIALTIILAVSVSMLLAVLLASDARGGDFISSFVYLLVIVLAAVAVLAPLRPPYTLLYALNPLTSGPVVVLLAAAGRILEAALVITASLILAGIAAASTLRLADPERMIQHRPLLALLRPRRFSAGDSS